MMTRCAISILAYITPILGVATTYTNPILPGWHSDPSCTFVAEWDDTFFCTTSTFLVFPGIPIYTSRDLVNWRLVSHALNRPEQLPGLSATTEQADGIYASTIRFHDGMFYLATAFLSGYNIPQLLLFTAKDPYDNASWSDPIKIPTTHYGYDPDLFWDLDGQLYVCFAGYNTTRNTEIMMASFDIATETTGDWSTIWTGTGALWPEGPHIYKRDEFYYLAIAEGGTGLNHSATIARAHSIGGPYTSYTGNPILTSNNTDAYFQTVGHVDLFQDKLGNSWGVALATRSGPEWRIYPMGRETVLSPVTWKHGGWPELEPVKGFMSGPLPQPDRDMHGVGLLIDEDDTVVFTPGSKLPRNFLTWRPQPSNLFTISPHGHPNTLRIIPSKANLTGDNSFAASAQTQSFISRLQTSTLFTFSVDVEFQPMAAGLEAGISVFLTQFQHIDLGIVQLRSDRGKLSPHFRFRVEASGLPEVVAPDTRIIPIPSSWLHRPITLIVSTPDDSTFVLSAAAASRKETIDLGRASAEIVSGGSGKFTGVLLGSYATTNGRNGSSPCYLSNWKYTPVAQKIEANDLTSTGP